MSTSLLIGSLLSNFNVMRYLATSGESRKTKDPVSVVNRPSIFFGIPIIAIVGQLLRVRAMHRQWLRSLSEEERNVHYTFREGADGFDIVSGDSFAHIGWRSVRRFSERPKYFSFEVAGKETLLVLKKFFKTDEDEQLLRTIADAGMAAKID